MPLLGKPIASVTEADVQSYIGNLMEGPTLDMKRDLPGPRDEDRREFLKDVIALANHRGGILVYGIDDDNGVAHELAPITVVPHDKAIQQLTAVIRSSTEPVLMDFEFHPVGISGGYVLLLDVGASPNPPHRFVHGNTSRFYKRVNRDAQPMTIEDLRAAFRTAATREQEMRQFREARLADIENGRVAMPVDNTHRNMFLHVLPVMRMEAPNLKAQIQNEVVELRPPNRGGHTYGALRFWNFDGLAFRAEGSDPDAYTLIFRDGTVEGVLTNIVDRNPQTNTRTMHVGLIASAMIQTLPRYVRAMTANGAGRMFGVMLSLTRMDRVVAAEQLANNPQRPRPCDRVSLLFDPFLLSADDVEADGWERHLRPTLDALWQAWGMPACNWYGEDDRLLPGVG